LSAAPRVEADRAIADLRELRRRTHGPSGAERVAWTEGWRRARGFLQERLVELGLPVERDEAGNLWAELQGRSSDAVAVGSHLDSVPGGGWLDGALGVMAGLEVLRTAREGGVPEHTLVLVDFADEEGARFGHSLLGSSAVSGHLDPAPAGALTDPGGATLADALAENGVDIDQAGSARSRADRLTSYIELHIEQGPVLAERGIPVAAVRGTMGIERRRWAIEGRSGHAGATPMAMRSDPLVAAARAIDRLQAIAADRDALGTVGRISAEPGTPTAIASRIELIADLRAESKRSLAELSARFAEAVETSAAELGCTARSEPLFSVPPTTFDRDLVRRATEICRSITGSELELVSGPGHDAVEMSRVVPAAMLFAPSKGGISHAPDEDTDEADLAVAIEAFGALALELAGPLRARDS
jgi:hydantoinase/carbamoylase family amidase